MFSRKKQPKVKEPSEREIRVKQITSEVEQLSEGQTLIYKLPEFYWSGFAAFLIVELNPSYPEKGRKYIMSTDKANDGKPAGHKVRSWESNKPKDIADWIAPKSGVRFS